MCIVLDLANVEITRPMVDWLHAIESKDGDKNEERRADSDHAFRVDRETDKFDAELGVAHYMVLHLKDHGDLQSDGLSMHKRQTV